MKSTSLDLAAKTGQWVWSNFLRNSVRRCVGVIFQAALLPNDPDCIQSNQVGHMRKVSTSRTKKFTSGQSWVLFFSRARKSNYCSTGAPAVTVIGSILAINHMANATDNARSRSRWTEVCIPRAAANRSAINGQSWAWHWEWKSQLIWHRWKLIQGFAQQRFSLSLWQTTNLILNAAWTAACGASALTLQKHEDHQRDQPAIIPSNCGLPVKWSVH